MRIKDILQLENSNTLSIILHKEGLFWRAYELSAYLFTLYIKDYQVTKKFYKNAKQEVVYLGFPANFLEQILKIAKEKNITKKETQIFIGKYELKKEDFINWKSDIQLWQSSEKVKTDLSGFEDLIGLSDKIKNFPIASKTPIECQQFIIQLQNELS